MSISRDTFDPTKNYRRIRYHQRRDLLDSELNEQQDIALHEQQQLFDTLFAQGAITQGLQPTVNGAVVTLTAGNVYVDGHLVTVPGATLQYDGAKVTGTDYVWLEVLCLVVDASEDASLINPTTGEPTAEREQWVATVHASDPSGDPFPEHALGRTVVAIYDFHRDTGQVLPSVTRPWHPEDAARLDGHIGQGGDEQHPVATEQEAGFLSAADKTKLDSLLAGGVPVGAVMAFATLILPGGWLECNGALISRQTYAALFAAIGTTFGAGNGVTTFALPDLRGEFVRGWDHGRGVDPGRAFGGEQDHAFLQHGQHVGGIGNYPGYVSLEDGQDTPNYPLVSIGGTETRPRNVALVYCIKY